MSLFTSHSAQKMPVDKMTNSHLSCSLGEKTERMGTISQDIVYALNQWQLYGVIPLIGGIHEFKNHELGEKKRNHELELEMTPFPIIPSEPTWRICTSFLCTSRQCGSRCLRFHSGPGSTKRYSKNFINKLWYSHTMKYYLEIKRNTDTF